MTFDLKNATHKIFDRVHKTGEEIKNDLPNWVERVVKNEGWKKILDPSTGKPFSDVGKWLVAGWPNGPGMGIGRHAITYDEFILLCADRPAIKTLLVKHRPKGKPGPKTELDSVNNVKETKPPRGNSRAYLEQRLAKDFPEIWDDYLNGKYKSARQAAIAAGFMKDTHDPVARMKSNWNKATKKERAVFLKWIEQN
jgi:hypothetical protein